MGQTNQKTSILAFFLSFWSFLFFPTPPHQQTQRSSLKMLRFITTAVLFATAALEQVEGHGYISSPRPRAQTINGHRFAYEPQSDGQKNGECWDAERNLSGGLQATYTEGQTITTAVRITAFHKGWHEIRLCDNINGKNNC